MNSLAKPFEWTEYEGKQYATQAQFAELLGIDRSHLKSHLSKRGIDCANLVQLVKPKRILYPIEVVSLALMTLETKSDLGMQLKKKMVELFLNKPQLKQETPLLPAPKKEPRDQLRQKVAEIAQYHDLPYNEVWKKLWVELYYRCKVNVKTRAKNQDKRPLDLIDDLGLCEKSVAILDEVYS